MKDTTEALPPPAEQPQPLDALIRMAIADPGNFPVAGNARGDRRTIDWQTEAVMNVLHGGGWVLHGTPPASRLLADAQHFAERVILAELAVRLFRVLVLGNVILEDTPKAMDWLRDWIDGNLEGHGPIGKPMIWPSLLPSVQVLLRQWGFMPTPTIPPYVTRNPEAKNGQPVAASRP